MIPLIPMPYHERRGRRETLRWFEDWWGCAVCAALAWLLVLAMGYGIKALFGSGS